MNFPLWLCFFWAVYADLCIVNCGEVTKTRNTQVLLGLTKKLWAQYGIKIIVQKAPKICIFAYLDNWKRSLAWISLLSRNFFCTFCSRHPELEAKKIIYSWKIANFFAACKQNWNDIEDQMWILFKITKLWSKTSLKFVKNAATRNGFIIVTLH